MVAVGALASAWAPARTMVLGRVQLTNDRPLGYLFSIAGSVDGVFPGGARPITVSLQNREVYDIWVTAVRTEVGDANAGCTGSLLTVPEWKGKYKVKARSKGSITLTATLAAGAPDVCQGATFPLRYVGDAQPDLV